MTLNTKHFGQITVDESKLLDFDNGIPGFEEMRKFTLLSDSGPAENPFYWLQSIDHPDIAFVMMDVLRLYPEYNPLVDKDIIEAELGAYNQEHFFVYNIANIPENVADTTVNLKAPIVINDKSKKGMQIICDNDEYSVKHFLFK